MRTTFLAAALAAVSGAASAADLPFFASGPETARRDSASIWSGLSIGSEVIVAGAKGYKTGIGGATRVQWAKTFDNNVIFAIRASAGNMPSLWATPLGANRISGYNFVSTEAVVGYDFGRVKPWVAVGGAWARPTANNALSGLGLNAANGFFEEKGRTQGFVTYGAGVDFAVTNKFSVGVSVNGVQRQ